MMTSLAGMLGGLGTHLLEGAADFGGDLLDGVTGAVSNKVGTAALGSVGPQANAITQPQSIGINSVQQGSNVPAPGAQQPSESAGTQAGKLVVDTAKDIVTGVSSQASSQLANDLVTAAFGDNRIAQAKLAGKASRGYLDAAFPEANVWDKMGQSGAAASGVSGAMSMNTAAQQQTRAFGQELIKQNNELNNNLKIAGINSATSRMNTLDTLRVNEKDVDQRIALSKEQMLVQQQTQKLLEQQSLTQQAQQGLLGEQSAATRAGADRTRALTPAELRNLEAQAKRSEKPGHVGEALTTAEKVYNEAKAEFKGGMLDPRAKVADWDMTIDEGLQKLKDWYHGEKTNHEKASGVSGTMSRK